MNADEALRRFAEDEGLPRDAMAWALEHWEAAAPRFIAKLRAFAAGAAGDEAVEDQVFYILHLCGQTRETRAYEPLCRLIAGDPDIEVWLGDAIGETLPGILINVFDGDVGPLLAAIEEPAGDEFARGSALSALGYLVRSKRALDDEAMRELLRRLRREALPREASGFWFCWAETAAALGYEDLKMEAALLTKEGLLERRRLRARRLRGGRRSCAQRSRRARGVSRSEGASLGRRDRSARNLDFRRRRRRERGR